MPFKDQHRDMIMHAWLQVDDQALMGCDAPRIFQKPMSGFSVSFHTTDVAEARRMFDALAEGGLASMPFRESLWCPGFGMVTHRFGTPWLVNTMPLEAQDGTRALSDRAMVWTGRILSGLFALFMLGASAAPELLGMPVAEHTLVHWDGRTDTPL